MEKRASPPFPSIQRSVVRSVDTSDTGPAAAAAVLASTLLFFSLPATQELEECGLTELAAEARARLDTL